jgi:predicted nucleic acid-binding protein
MIFMNLVIDTSVLIAVLTSEPEREKLIQQTQGVDLLAPPSVHWEIGNALSAMLKRKRISREQVNLVLNAYEQIPIRFVDIDMYRAMNITAEHDLYAYDAYIIACAQENRCSLISLDKGLLQSAQAAGVTIQEVEA